MIKRVLKEPLLHFLLLAAAVFGSYHLIGGGAGQPAGDIVVSAPKIAQLAAVFEKSWHRQPDAAELKGMIDDYVREEIYVREALAMGLDADDTVIRRRLRQKMEFLTAPDAGSLKPDESELGEYLKAHPDKFSVEPVLAFQQVFINPGLHQEGVSQAVASLLHTLQSNPDVDPAELGDPSLLPPDMPPTGKLAIGQMFGEQFADALLSAVPGQWTGPVTSGVGLHIVRVTERKPGQLPPLAQVREAVMREWTSDKQQEAQKQQLDALLQRYRVKIEFPVGQLPAGGVQQ